MGQKSNVNTLKKFNKENLSNSDIKLNILEINTINYLKLLFRKNRVYSSKINLGFINNRIHITIYSFFSSAQNTKFKKKRVVGKSVKLFNKFLKNLLNYSKILLLEIKIINLNKFLIQTNTNKKLIVKIFNIYKRYINNLFSKRFFLCIDTTKITALYILNKIESITFLEFFGKIFSGIHKKNHLKYCKLLNTVFNFLVTNAKSNHKIIGLRLLIAGKLLGKNRSSHQLISCGPMPAQTLNKDISFDKIHTFTPYGVFGLKLWIYKIK